MVVVKKTFSSLYEEVHSHHPHFTMGDARLLHSFLLWSHGKVTAEALVEHFDISYDLAVSLKQQYQQF
jgi:predicted N-formylglutamate amidohydrolase